MISVSVTMTCPAVRMLRGYVLTFVCAGAGGCCCAAIPSEHVTLESLFNNQGFIYSESGTRIMHNWVAADPTQEQNHRLATSTAQAPAVAREPAPAARDSTLPAAGGTSSYLPFSVSLRSEKAIRAQHHNISSSSSSSSSSINTFRKGIRRLTSFCCTNVHIQVCVPLHPTWQHKQPWHRRLLWPTTSSSSSIQHRHHPPPPHAATSYSSILKQSGNVVTAEEQAQRDKLA